MGAVFLMGDERARPAPRPPRRPSPLFPARGMEQRPLICTPGPAAPPPPHPSHTHSRPPFSLSPHLRPGPRAHPVGELCVVVGHGGGRQRDDEQVQRGQPRRAVRASFLLAGLSLYCLCVVEARAAALASRGCRRRCSQQQAAASGSVFKASRPLNALSQTHTHTHTHKKTTLPTHTTPKATTAATSSSTRPSCCASAARSRSSASTPPSGASTCRR